MPPPPGTRVLASIPSPGVSTLQLGPLELHYYGIVIAIGVALAFSITRRRYERYGGDGELLDRVMVWTVLVGFLGGRTGYVLTHLDTYFGAGRTKAPWQALAIWEGGLAFYGGIVFGAVTAFVLLRRFRQPVLPFFDAVSIAVPVAQAMGRLGNWFNQELFGTPTDLPWGLEIDPANRPAAYPDAATFHPTFLYEALWNLVSVAVIVRLERSREWKRGSLFLLYLVLYGIGRFLTELIRTDTTFRLLGLSRNGLIALGAIVVGSVVLARRETGGGDPLEALVAADEALLADRSGDDADTDAPDDATGDEQEAAADA